MFYLILLYSLLPGFSKLLGVNIIFSLNIPIVMYMMFGIRWTKTEINIVVLFLVICILNTIQAILVNDNFSIVSFGSSFYVWIFPMIGFFMYKKYDLNQVLQSIVHVVLVHVIIGFVTYGFVELPSFIQYYVEILREGVGWYRMSSVAGSLIFGVLTSCAFNIQMYLIYQRKDTRIREYLKLVIILFGCLLSLQRSSWIAIIPSIIFYLVSNRNSIFVLLFVFTPVALVSVSFILNNEFYYDRFLSLFSNDFSPVDERYKIWLNGLDYFNKNFFGHGIGQVGQFAYKSDLSIPYYITDGDYFKILAEGGILIFWIYMSILALIFYRLVISSDIKNDLFLFFVVLGFFVQMIGSNISEFYFANYIFWVLIGFFIFGKQNNGISSHSHI